MKNERLSYLGEKTLKDERLTISIGYAAGAAKTGTEQIRDAAPPQEISGDTAPPQEINGDTALPQEISGDTAISCRLPEGNRALILSDGMGKGIKAAAESGLAVSLLRKLLKQGAAPAAAIKTVNKRLISKEGETFATIDLTIVDLTIGKARFYKMGAAASYLVRGTRVRKIQKAALPVGIIPSLRLSHESINLLPGDIIVMVSDGITESDRADHQADWVVNMLTELKSGAETVPGPRQLALRILCEAQRRYENRETDDSTVIVAAIRQTD